MLTFYSEGSMRTACAAHCIQRGFCLTLAPLKVEDHPGIPRLRLSTRLLGSRSMEVVGGAGRPPSANLAASEPHHSGRAGIASLRDPVESGTQVGGRLRTAATLRIRHDDAFAGAEPSLPRYA